MNVRRVVCAAIRARDGEVLIGIRHYSADMRRQIDQRVDGSKFMHRLDEYQGFVDQHGIFMNRAEAYQVAKAAGQPIIDQACGARFDDEMRLIKFLYSEALY